MIVQKAKQERELTDGVAHVLDELGALLDQLVARPGSEQVECLASLLLQAVGTLHAVLG